MGKNLFIAGPQDFLDHQHKIQTATLYELVILILDLSGLSLLVGKPGQTFH
jgi:hypothetical protein